MKNSYIRNRKERAC